jgi:hypothetical protein
VHRANSRVFVATGVPVTVQARPGCVSSTRRLCQYDATSATLQIRALVLAPLAAPYDGDGGGGGDGVQPPISMLTFKSHTDAQTVPQCNGVASSTFDTNPMESRVPSQRDGLQLVCECVRAGEKSPHEYEPNAHVSQVLSSSRTPGCTNQQLEGVNALAARRAHPWPRQKKVCQTVAAPPEERRAERASNGMGALSILAYVRLVICDHLLDACFQLELRPPHLGVEVDKRATVQQRCILETPLTRRKHTNKPHAKPLLGASKTNSEFKCASLHTLPPDRHPCALSLTGRADPDLAGRAIKSQSKMCHSVS